MVPRSSAGRIAWATDGGTVVLVEPREEMGASE